MEDNRTPNDLEKLIHEDTSVVFNPECVRKKSNISKAKKEYRIDSPYFSPEILLKDIKTHSPKLVALLDKIEELDRNDRREYGKVFKHFIYSDLKSSASGAKLLASALAAKGFHCGYNANLLNPSKFSKNKKKRDSSPMIDDDSDDDDSEDDDDSDDDDSDESSGDEGDDENRKNKPKEKIWGKIELKTPEELEEHPHRNFFLLTSRGVYDQAINVKLKKDMLSIFNKRPENIDGKQCRFIVMDSGYKEGIDLFDIKYIHIFEPSLVMADQKQVIGRGTRTCGQKGLDFHPRRGWKLDVFIYDLEIPSELKHSFMDSKSAMELYMKSMNLNFRIIQFADELEKTSVFGSVDYDLNKNIHTFSIPSSSDDENDEERFVYNGGADISKKLNRKLRIKGTNKGNITSVEPIVIPQQEIVLPNGIVIGQQVEHRMGHEEMREHIAEHFNEFEWEKIKMENLCEPKKEDEKQGEKEEKKKCGSPTSQLLKFNPTQNFIRHYFTPENPLKGILLWHSVGTGKTCTAIATASSNYEKKGYTILWVTRSTLKTDIWKNMFDQVCSETIREKIINENLVIPEDSKSRMKLLSKAWSIRPMSYKQFSNLVSKKNEFYKALVKKNGAVDPLRKTFLIIDEAHKLYGGDLSTLEQPDMPEFHKALMNSYQISGKDSVKLLLMTATPITDSPMEMMRLLNLCKLPEEQFPTDFDTFSEEYLNENGMFSSSGKKKYLDQIAGHISYLNREKDARQFAQPVIHEVKVPIAENIAEIKKMDKTFLKEQPNEELIELEKKLEEQEEQISEDLKNVDRATFNALKDQCKKANIASIPKLKTRCNTLVRNHIRKLIGDIKDELNEMKNNIKKTKREIQKRQLRKKTELANVGEYVRSTPEKFDEFKETAYYTLKSKCGKKIKSVSDLKKSLGEHPSFVAIDREIDRLNQQIHDQKQELKNNLVSYQKRIEEIKKLLKTYDLNTLEKQVIRSTLRSERVKMRKINTANTRKANQRIRDYNKQINDLKREREYEYKDLRKTVKKRIKEEKAIEKKNEKEAAAIRKSLRKQEDFREEITDEKIKTMIEDAAKTIETEMEEETGAINKIKEEKEAEKLRKKVAKEEIRKTKKAAKEEEMLRKKREKEELRKTKKAEKKAAKEEEMLRKKKEKEELRKTKKAEKERERLQKKMNKTRKNG